MTNTSKRVNKERIKSLSSMHSNEKLWEMLKRSRRHFTDQSFNANASFGVRAGANFTARVINGCTEPSTAQNIIKSVNFWMFLLTLMICK